MQRSTDRTTRAFVIAFAIVEAVLILGALAYAKLR